MNPLLLHLPLISLLPLFSLSELCTVQHCRGANSNHTIHCLNHQCTALNTSQPACSSTPLKQNPSTKDCKYGCQLDEDGSVYCRTDLVKRLPLGRTEMLALVVGVSCLGLVTATCFAQCYTSKKVTERSDIILQNINNTGEKLVEEDEDGDGSVFELNESHNMLSVI